MGDKRIPISESNRNELKSLKRGDDTYDDVIERLLTDDFELTREVEQVDVDALVNDLVDEIGATVGGPQVDDSKLAREVTRQIDYVELANRVSEQVVAELGGGR